ncbi:MAG TPA: S53 family peptidase [Mycobacteriales bacterium]|nr:S53 family peptidase [Mycobacteriales bacterium]
MRPRVLSLLCAVPLGVAALGILPAASSAAPSTQQLTAALLPGLDTATDLGAVPSSTLVRVGVALAHPDTAGEEAYASGVYDPASPLFHRFLTPAAYAQRFGVPAATYQRVVSGITAKGLSVIYSSPSRDYALVRGTAAQVDATFGTKEHRFRLADGTLVRATSTAPTVDSAVSAVLGLDDFQRFHFAATAPKIAAPKQDLCLQGICTGALTPQDLWSIYDLPGGNRGDGQKVAIFGEGQVFDGQPATGVPGNDIIDNLRLFEQTYGLPRVNVRTVLAADDQTATDGTEEWDIDSQAVNGMAPDLAELDYYFGNSLAEADMVPAFDAWANDPQGPLQGNFSVGGCESLNYILGAVAAEGPIYRQLATEGRTLFASTGDTGGSCMIGGPVNINGVGNTVVPQVEWPASSPYVVAVGGTVLYGTDTMPIKRNTEYAWTHTGGGASIMEPAPLWQRQIASKNPLVMPSQCAIHDDGSPVTAKTLCRGVPDVAALSGDVLTNGYTIVDAQTPQGGGTSLASPLWAGMWARVQAASAAGLGLASPALYAAAQDPVKDYRDFFDVRLGSNGQYVARFRTAAQDPTGWDYVSGLGTPDVTNLAQDIAGQVAPTNPGRPAEVPDQVVHPTASCPPAGSMTDQAGDGVGAFGFYPSETGLNVPVNDPAADLTGATIAWDASAQTLTWTDTVSNLSYPAKAAASPVEVEDQFAVGDKTWELRAARAVDGTTTFAFGSYDPASFVETDLAPVTGSFDASTNTITVVLPASTFASASGTSLASGTVLTSLTVLADAYVNEDQNSFTGPDGMDQMTGPCALTLA